MKVVHVITGLHTGGAETMLHKLLLAMDRKRFQPEVVSLLDGGEILEKIVDAGIPVHELGMKRGLPTPATLLKLRGLARDLEPDVIQGWMYHGNLAGSFMSYFASGTSRLFWNIRHSLYDLDHEKPMTRMIIRLGAVVSNRPRRIFYNSTVSMEQHTLLGFRRGSGLMLPNGFDLEKFQPDPLARPVLRAELGLDPKTILVGVVGRRHPLKGHDDFLRSAMEVNRRHPEVHFVLAGRGVTRDDPSFGEYLKNRDLARHIHFLGQRSDMPRLFASLDLLAMPSVSEGFPNVLGEAMACGIPCVATDVGESREIVADTGSIVPPGKPGEMAAAIDAMLDLDETALADLGRRGRKKILENYSLENIADRYAELYASA